MAISNPLTPTKSARTDSSARVLVVDDDPEMAELLQHLLEENDCLTIPAMSGEEGWQVLLSSLREPNKEFDLIILDVMMGGMDGFELCARIKGHEQLRFTPVLMMTALSTVDDKTLGLGVGADDYVTKPFDPREMMARVGAMLRIRRMELELRQRNREMATLNAINQTVTSSLDLDRILDNAMQGISEILSVETGALVLVKKSSDELITIKQLGPPASALAAGQETTPNRSVIEYVVQHKEPVLSDDISSDSRFATETCPQPQGDGRSALCVPLVVKQKVVGAISVCDKLDASFDQKDVEILSSIAASVASAIENARLYRELGDFARELERSQAQLVQAEKMAATGRLAASIAHEINNPLQAIHNSLHLTLRANLPEEKRSRYLAMAQEEVERLIDIVRRLLEFYRPSRGCRVETDVNDIVDNTLVLTNKRLQHSHIEVETDLHTDIPSLMLVPDQLTQVFLNVVINAIEAMPGGGELRIRTRLSSDGEWVKILFRDTGTGIGPEAQMNIFEPFFTTKRTGTGLGLAISYGIVERHGGNIEVSSQPGEGATFTVCLPVLNDT